MELFTYDGQSHVIIILSTSICLCFSSLFFLIFSSQEFVNEVLML
jgi:hypothetical protein